MMYSTLARFCGSTCRIAAIRSMSSAESIGFGGKRSPCLFAIATI